MGRKFRLAEKLAEFYADIEERKNIKILDIAAGTGLAGIGLLKQGFQYFDAIGKCYLLNKINKKALNKYPILFLRWISSHVKTVEC